MQTDILSRLKIIAVPPEFIPRNLLGLIPPILIYICDDISILLCSNDYTALLRRLVQYGFSIQYRLVQYLSILYITL